ncbi:thioesterase domain-containing protein [Streptomyces sp. NPDC051105]|uniref:thioesterase II family protein n=1 Tax=Streptomyces sp. NPDC051105 TaxID=3154843 RepID=UPI00341D671A
MRTARQPGRLLLRDPQDWAAARLFCFPYSGLGASMYNKWPRRMGDVEICLIQPPGRENRIREPHFGTYEAFAEQAAERLLPHLDRPFGFFGHCGGVLPAFATALHLARNGLPCPDILFVSSQVAPHDGPYGRFLSMTDAELAEELMQLTRAMGGLPQPDLIDINLRVLRADLGASQQYRLEQPVIIPSDIHAIGWRDDREIEPALMGGWTSYTEPRRFSQTILPGGHYDFLRPPEKLLELLAEGCSAPRGPRS